MAPSFPFDTRAALQTWLEHEGLGHLARLNLEAVAPAVDPASWPHLRAQGARRRLIDLVNLEGLARWKETPASPLRETLPAVVEAFLLAQGDEARAARALDVERTQAPSDARARPTFERLQSLRASVPASVAPRLSLTLDDLELDPKLPGFRFKDLLPCEMPLRAGGSFARPEVRLWLTTPPRVECTCGASACVHVLAAIDTAALWLRQPLSPRRLTQLEALQQPGWARALQALDEALAQPAAASALELWWHLRVFEDAGVDVLPWAPGSKSLTRKRLLTELAGQLTDDDRRIVALLPEADTLASRALLDSLVDHPRAVLASDPEKHVRIERLAVGIVADDRGGSVHVGLGLEGAALPAQLAERVRRARPEEVLFLWDEGPRRLTLLDVKAELRTVLAVLQREGNLFPPESQPKLLDSLSRWAQRLPVAMPRSVLGESVAPALTQVLRLEAHANHSVEVELRVRPLAGSGAFLPGQGARDVHVRREGRALHAVRDFARERALAEAFCALLPLERAEELDAPFSWRFEDGRGALELLDCEAVRGRLQAGQGAPSEVEGPPRLSARTSRTAEGRSGGAPLDSARGERSDFLHHEGGERSDSLPGEGSATGDLLRGVKLELEWVGTPVRSVGAPSPRALTVKVEQRRDWFGALGGLSVGGERVELARLLDAARRKEKWIEVRPSTWLELTADLQRHLESLSAHVHVTNHGLELGPSAADALRALERDGATVEADATWAALAERVAAAKELKPKVPKGLTFTLRPYQEEGFRWLLRLASWGAGGVLDDDMGLGKTVQALAVLLARAKLGPALVVAPTSVAFNWRDEAKACAPGLRVRLYGEEADRAEALESAKAGDVLVVSYGLLVRDSERLSQKKFATLVFDEAQHLKNATTQRTRAARALQSDFRFALSGTPLENNVGELWSLFAAIFPRLLGSWELFRKRYAIPIERGVDPAAAPNLALVIGPFLLRRTKAVVEAELPPRTEVRVPVVLSAAEWQLYEDARLALLSELESRKSVLKEQERRVEVLAGLTRLRLMASHPRLYDVTSDVPSAKLARLLELVEELRAEGQRALVFSQFTTHLALVKEALIERGIEFVSLDGQTPAKQRRELVHGFQQGRAPLFLISLKAGGFGLNLTAATNVIHLDPWWNPAVEDQASDRAHRLGQTKPVTIYRLVAMGTIEEQMLSLHEAKRALVSRVLAGTELGAKLSTADLLALLARGSASQSGE